MVIELDLPLSLVFVKKVFYKALLKSNKIFTLLQGNFIFAIFTSGQFFMALTNNTLV